MDNKNIGHKLFRFGDIVFEFRNLRYPKFSPQIPLIQTIRV